MKRSIRWIPIIVVPMNDGIADAQGFKHFRLIVGEGGLRPVIQMHCDVSKSGGEELVKFKVVNAKESKK